MTWQDPPPQTTDYDHHLRCLSHGEGSSLQWFQDRGSLESLELLAATLAAKTFLKDQTDVTILMQLDNQTAVAFVNNMGGTVSVPFTDLAKALWL